MVKIEVKSEMNFTYKMVEIEIEVKQSDESFLVSNKFLNIQISISRIEFQLNVRSSINRFVFFLQLLHHHHLTSSLHHHHFTSSSPFPDFLRDF